MTPPDVRTYLMRESRIAYDRISWDVSVFRSGLPLVELIDVMGDIACEMLCGDHRELAIYRDGKRLVYRRRLYALEELI